MLTRLVSRFWLWLYNSSAGLRRELAQLNLRESARAGRACRRMKAMRQELVQLRQLAEKLEADRLALVSEKELLEAKLLVAEKSIEGITRAHQALNELMRENIALRTFRRQKRLAQQGDTE